MSNFKATEAELMLAIENNANGADYTGRGDVSLDFGKMANSFANEPSSTREVSVSIKNDGSTDVTIALNPGYFTQPDNVKDENGVPVELFLQEGELASASGTVTVKGLPKSIDEFLAFVQKHPTRVHTLMIQASSADQLEVPMLHRPCTPFAGGQEFSQIIPARSTNEDTQNDKRATVDLQAADFQFDCDTVIVYKVKAGVQVQLTFQVGAIADQCKELRTRAQVGRVNAANV